MQSRYEDLPQLCPAYRFPCSKHVTIFTPSSKVVLMCSQEGTSHGACLQLLGSDGVIWEIHADRLSAVAFKQSSHEVIWLRLKM